MMYTHFFPRSLRPPILYLNSRLVPELSAVPFSRTAWCAMHSLRERERERELVCVRNKLRVKQVATSRDTYTYAYYARGLKAALTLRRVLNYLWQRPAYLRSGGQCIACNG